MTKDQKETTITVGLNACHTYTQNNFRAWIYNSGVQYSGEWLWQKNNISVL